MPTEARFAGRVALVTAAAAGIGRATVERMTREGASVIAVDRDEAGLKQGCDHLLAKGFDVLGLPCDALDPASVDAAVARAIERHGTIDILVNGVGGSTGIANPAAPVEDLSFAEWQQLIAFNVDATFLFCHAVVPFMKQQRHGKIVNISSIAGRGLSPISSIAYATGKGGIIALTKKLSAEVASHGITVNAIAPSFTMTERMQPIWAARDEASRKAAEAAVPLGRIATSEDQAGVICFLASADADFVTGITIDVTGGL